MIDNHIVGKFIKVTSRHIWIICNDNRLYERDTILYVKSILSISPIGDGYILGLEVIDKDFKTERIALNTNSDSTPERSVEIIA